MLVLLVESLQKEKRSVVHFLSTYEVPSVLGAANIQGKIHIFSLKEDENTLSNHSITTQYETRGICKVQQEQGNGISPTDEESWEGFHREVGSRA